MCSESQVANIHSPRYITPLPYGTHCVVSLSTIAKATDSRSGTFQRKEGKRKVVT
jgi:hypothetical protein